MRWDKQHSTDRSRISRRDFRPWASQCHFPRRNLLHCIQSFQLDHHSSPCLACWSNPWFPTQSFPFLKVDKLECTSCLTVKLFRVTFNSAILCYQSVFGQNNYEHLVDNVIYKLCRYVYSGARLDRHQSSGLQTYFFSFQHPYNCCYR